MLNFEFQNPTKIIFGKNSIEKLNAEIPLEAKVLLLYGGGSIKKNGVYKQVVAALGQRSFTEFGGIPANPEYDVLYNALGIIKKEKIDYLLAVGGGSVIDGCKFLSSAALYEGEDPWDILAKNIRTEKGMPFGTVLTLPATGSEMNSGSVITRSSIKEKRTMGGPGLFPQFSVLDPEVVTTLPDKQVANGIADAFTHVLEQYMTYPAGALLQDRFCESILQTLIEVGPKVLNDRNNYEATSNFMWCCTMALNGLIQKGVPTDWAIHAMGHELTALYGIDHARTLAIVLPSHYTFNFERKKAKLAQYGRRVWKLSGDDDNVAKNAIAETVHFFHGLGIKTKLSDYIKDYQGTAETIAQRFTERNWLGLGEHKDLKPTQVQEIMTMTY